MKKLKFIIFLFIAIMLQSCESSDVVEVNIDGNERIVIEGVLTSGKLFRGVKITRTLPLEADYDIKTAEIKDAYAYLVINKVQIVPLHYKADGNYLSLYDLTIESGNTYEFYAYINNNRVYGYTTVPYKPTLLSYKYIKSGYFEARVSPHSGEAYGAIWVIVSGGTKKAANFYSIDMVDEINMNPVVTRTTMLDEKYLSSYYDGKRKIQVFAFDKQFAPYYNNSAKNITMENSFLTGASGVAWNITGKNAIGLFIGMAEGGLEDE